MIRGNEININQKINSSSNNPTIFVSNTIEIINVINLKSEKESNIPNIIQSNKQNPKLFSPQKKSNTKEEKDTIAPKGEVIPINEEVIMEAGNIKFNVVYEYPDTNGEEINKDFNTSLNKEQEKKLELSDKLMVLEKKDDPTPQTEANNIDEEYKEKKENLESEKEIKKKIQVSNKISRVDICQLFSTKNINNNISEKKYKRPNIRLSCIKIPFSCIREMINEMLEKLGINKKLNEPNLNTAFQIKENMVKNIKSKVRELLCLNNNKTNKAILDEISGFEPSKEDKQIKTKEHYKKIIIYFLNRSYILLFLNYEKNEKKFYIDGEIEIIKEFKTIDEIIETRLNKKDNSYKKKFREESRKILKYGIFDITKEKRKKDLEEHIIIQSEKKLNLNINNKNLNNNISLNENYDYSKIIQKEENDIKNNNNPFIHLKDDLNEQSEYFNEIGINKITNYHSNDNYLNSENNSKNNLLDSQNTVNYQYSEGNFQLNDITSFDFGENFINFNNFNSYQ